MFASFHVKEGGAPEHTHLLHNRHRPPVAVQKCLTASTKFCVLQTSFNFVTRIHFLVFFLVSPLYTMCMSARWLTYNVYDNNIP